MKSVLPFLAIGAVLLSGCGGPAAAESTSTPTPTPSVEATASAKQFASILAESESSWRAYAADSPNCAYDRTIATDDASKIHILTCTMTAATVTIQAKTAQKNIVKLPKPSPEVKDLVDRTLAALAPLAGSGADTACMEADATTSAKCDEAETAANGAVLGVISVLNAWRPYLGS